MTENEIDYASSGLTLQQAMVAHVKKHSVKKGQPVTICWGDHRVQTSNLMHVAREGIVVLELLSSPRNIRQGVDLKVDGWLQLPNGNQVPVLRTWQDPRFEDVVEYPYSTKSGGLWTWNVYEMTYPGGRRVEEKWTGNAGFWVEPNGDDSRIYHCSHGMATHPDFESLVYKLTIKPK